MALSSIHLLFFLIWDPKEQFDCQDGILALLGPSHNTIIIFIISLKAWPKLLKVKVGTRPFVYGHIGSKPKILEILPSILAQLQKNSSKQTDWAAQGLGESISLALNSPGAGGCVRCSASPRA